MDHPSASLPALAGVLRTSPESDALVILGQLLDSLPIGFYATDCSDDFRIVYANRAWAREVTGGKLPLVGRPLSEIIETAERSGLLGIMRGVHRSARPRHLKGFELGGQRRAGEARRPGPARWDWEIYPLSDAADKVTHVLSVVFKLAPHAKPSMSEVPRRETKRRQEEAAGVLRIFGMPSEASGPEREVSDLTERERRVADLVAAGLTNFAVARQLGVSPSTVSSHVAHILAKFEFRSRAQIAGWAVEQRLRRPTGD